jgi:hypothetical protein
LASPLFDGLSKYSNSESKWQWANQRRKRRQRGPLGRGFGYVAIFTVLNLCRIPTNPSQVEESQPPLARQMSLMLGRKTSCHQFDDVNYLTMSD